MEGSRGQRHALTATATGAKASETAAHAGSRGLRVSEEGWRGAGGGKLHLPEVVLAAPAPRTGGGDRPPLRVQRRESLSSGPVAHAGATAGAYRAFGSLALLLHSRPSLNLRPPRPIPFQNARNVLVVIAAGLST